MLPSLSSSRLLRPMLASWLWPNSTAACVGLCGGDRHNRLGGGLDASLLQSAHVLRVRLPEGFAHGGATVGVRGTNQDVVFRNARGRGDPWPAERVMDNTGFEASSDTRQVRSSASRTSALARNSPSQGWSKTFFWACSSAMLSSVNLTEAEAARLWLSCSSRFDLLAQPARTSLSRRRIRRLRRRSLECVA